MKKANVTNELARERNRAAADRTLMAWIRTAIAMIGFGFGIGKITEALEEADSKIAAEPINSGLIFGEAFIALGVFGLLAAVIQHWGILKRIEQEEYVYQQPRALSMVVAILLLLIGLFAFVAILF